MMNLCTCPEAGNGFGERGHNNHAKLGATLCNCLHWAVRAPSSTPLGKHWADEAAGQGCFCGGFRRLLPPLQWARDDEMTADLIGCPDGGSPESTLPDQTAVQIPPFGSKMGPPRGLNKSLSKKQSLPRGTRLKREWKQGLPAHIIVMGIAVMHEIPPQHRPSGESGARLWTWRNPRVPMHTKGKQPPSSDLLAAGGHYSKAYHRRSSQSNNTGLLMSLLLVHVGICGPAEASGRTRISYCNTNLHPSPWVAHILRKGMDIWYTHYGHRYMGWGWGWGE